MNDKQAFDFWYAVNNTEVVHMPTRHLETFGTTLLNYHLVSELMDSVSQVRVREGRVLASQPKILTPDAFTKTLLEGFGDEAAKYVEWLRAHEKDLRLLQYGFTLKQEAFSEHVVTDNLPAVVERVKQGVKDRNDPFSAIAVGVDTPWDVCLVKMFFEVANASVKANVMQMEQRHLFDAADPAKRRRREIEAAFLEASRNPSLIAPLGQRLQRLGVFEEYQDRFFSLVKAGKQHR